MPPAPIRVPKSFKRRLKKKPPPNQMAIARAVAQLREDHRHPGLHSHRIWGAKKIWAVRLDAGDRLTYHWDGDVIVLRNHCNHDEVYRAP